VVVAILSASSNDYDIGHSTVPYIAIVIVIFTPDIIIIIIIIIINHV